MTTMVKSSLKASAASASILQAVVAVVLTSVMISLAEGKFNGKEVDRPPTEVRSFSFLSILLWVGVQSTPREGRGSQTKPPGWYFGVFFLFPPGVFLDVDGNGAVGADLALLSRLEASEGLW